MKPRLTVIIPCYNHGQYVGEAISSVRASKRDDIEIIVIDDGSKDPTTIQVMDTLQNDPTLRVIRQANAGLAAARNVGFTEAQADYVLPVDADNRIRPDYIHRGIEILDAKPKVGMVYGDAEYFGAKTGLWKIGPFDRDRLLYWNYIDACAVIRKAVWKENGGYRGDMPTMGLEDWEFWLNMMTHGWHFEYIPEIMFEYRVLPGSMIHNARARADATENFIADHYGRLYRAAWLERRSVTRTTQQLIRMVGERLRDRLPKTLRAG